MATLGIPGMGSGLRYEYGIFKQTVRDGWDFPKGIRASADTSSPAHRSPNRIDLRFCVAQK